jgi:hypothetical protein
VCKNDVGVQIHFFHWNIIQTTPLFTAMPAPIVISNCTPIDVFLDLILLVIYLFMDHSHAFLCGSNYNRNTVIVLTTTEANLFFSFIVGLCGGTLWHLQRFLQSSKYVILEFTPSITLLYPPSPNSWNSFNRYHFCIYIHVYTLFCTVFILLPPFACLLPAPTGKVIF